MNPETKLTTDEIRAICARHGIVYQSHKRITSGFTHEVHRLNDDMIIKLFNKTSNKNFLCESRILSVEDDRILKPKLIATYQAENDGRSYVIMSYIGGYSLGSVWHRTNGSQKEHLIAQIAAVLRAINDIDPSLLDFEEFISWNQDLDRKIAKLLKRLDAKSIIEPALQNNIRALVEASKSFYGSDDVIRPVYWDIHFDNFIVNESYELQAIIDLENVRMLTLDYPLFVVRKQMEDPKKYLSEKDEKYANTADYIHLWDWYKKYYPEMFAYTQLEKRIKLYQLLDVLHLLKDWSHVKELYSQLDGLMSDLSF